MRRVMLKEVISAVKLSVFPIWCWPMPKNTTRFKMSCMKLYHCWCVIMAMCLAAPLLYGIKNHIDEPFYLGQQIFLLNSCLHISSNFIFYQINYHHIQSVTYELENFCDLMKPHEEVIIQRYINKCVIFYAISIFTFYFCTFLQVTLIPPLLHQPLPTLSEYPFNVSYQPLKTIIYIQQSMVGVMVSAQLCTNVFMALLLWFATARFEILNEELKKATDFYPLFQCIKKHQELLKYAAKVALCARPIAFSTICCGTLSETLIIFLLLMTYQPTLQILQYSAVTVITLSEVFMFTWPGEYLMHICEDTAYAAYNAFKCDQSVEITKCQQIIIMRSQKPITVSIPCLMPALSFNYYTAYCSTILSYFTTLRVMVDDSN